MASKIVPYPPGFELLKKEPGYLAARAVWGKVIADNAKTIAPFETGSYRDGITSDKEGSVGSTHFTAHLIEFGTEDTPTFATIRKAVARSGLRLESALDIILGTSPED